MKNNEVQIVEKFKKITLEDRDIISKYLSLNKYSACDYSVGNLVLWSPVYNTHFAVVNNMLFIRFMRGEDAYFSFPLGNGDLKQAFEWMLAYCEEQNIKFQMNIVEPDMFEAVERIFPGEYEITYIRDSADYVYSTQDLKNLSGKKYHSKKNHINKFLSTNNDWTYEPISDENTPKCIEMVKEWCIQNGCGEDEAKLAEICVAINGIKNRKELNLTGGIIRIADRIIAMTMGERLCDDTFVIHFEKAFSDVDGAYPMINQQFIIHELADYTYVNREEDMGLEGLRRAKESYKPVFMAEKGILTKK